MPLLRSSLAGSFGAGCSAQGVRSRLLAPPRMSHSRLLFGSPELLGWAPWVMHVRRFAGGGRRVTPYGASTGRLSWSLQPSESRDYGVNVRELMRCSRWAHVHEVDRSVSAGADDRVRPHRGVIWTYQRARPIRRTVNLVDRRTSWLDLIARRSTWMTGACLGALGMCRAGLPRWPVLACPCAGQSD